MKHASSTDSGAARGSLKSYGVGFLLSIIFTAVAFGTVMSGALSHQAVVVIIFIAAILQILVHLRYFLHLEASSETMWNNLALIFAIVIMALFVGGSVWIMHNLNIRMM